MEDQLRRWVEDHLGYTVAVGDTDYTLEGMTAEGAALLKSDDRVKRMSVREVRNRFVRQNLAWAADGAGL